MNTVKNNFQRRLRASIALGVIFVVLICTNIMSFAADDYVYYQTWDEYKTANGISSDSEMNWQQKAEVICQVLDYAVTLFEEGHLYQEDPCAYDVVNKGGYYGYYETTGFERNMNGLSGSRVAEVELQFKTCRQTAKKNGTLETFTEEIENLKTMLREDAIKLDGGVADTSVSTDTSSDTTTDTSASSRAVIWTASFSIILREGFEAIIIVGAIIAYMQVSAGGDKKNRKRGARPVYIGSLLGIVASFGLAWLLNAIKLANTASQEVIEGVTALIAVCVLYYVSNWMLSKSETDAWVGYIKKKTTASSNKGATFALAFTAFLAVFREGAEVVLFYQPYLSSEYADYQANLWSGFVVGCICLVIVYLIIHYLSVKLPIKPFFTATSVLMFIMSISFLGAGIKELIEGDLLGSTSPVWLQQIIPYNDVLNVLGVYPILETLIPQIILLIISIVLFVIATKKNNKIHAEAEAKRAEERAIQEAADKKAREEALTAYIAKVLVDKGLVASLTEDEMRALQKKADDAVKDPGDVIANAGHTAMQA